MRRARLVVKDRRGHRARQVAGAVAVTGLVAVTGCRAGKAVTTTASVAETCVRADGTTSHVSRDVTTTVDPSSVTTGRPVTTTIDLPDFEAGNLILATGTVDVVFPLPAEIASVSSVSVTTSAFAANWTAAVEGRTVRLAYRHPSKVPALFAGTPALVITGVTHSSVDPARPARWLAYSSYETVEEEQGVRHSARCTPDDPNQVLASFSVYNPPF